MVIDCPVSQIANSLALMFICPKAIETIEGFKYLRPAAPRSDCNVSLRVLEVKSHTRTRSVREFKKPYWSAIPQQVICRVLALDNRHPLSSTNRVRALCNTRESRAPIGVSRRDFLANPDCILSSLSFYTLILKLAFPPLIIPHCARSTMSVNTNPTMLKPGKNEEETNRHNRSPASIAEKRYELGSLHWNRTDAG